MNLHHLELFYYVARHGGISRAVRHMPYGIQQPAMSSQMLALEQDLGAKLFERQPFRLTATGQELYDFARPFFDHAEAFGERLRQKRAPKLRIGSSELILQDYLPPVIEELRKAHPDVRLSLRSGYQAELENALQAGDIDLAIVPLDARPRAGLKCSRLVQLPLVMLVARNSDVKSAAQVWGQDPIEHPLICLPAGETITRAFRRGLREMRIDWPTSIEASSTALVTRYVENGYGLGVTVALPELVQNRKVRIIPLPGFDPIEIALLWRPPADAVHETLRSVIEKHAESLKAGIRKGLPSRGEAAAGRPTGAGRLISRIHFSTANPGHRPR